MKQHPKLWANVLFAAVVLAAAGLLFFLRSSRPGSAKLEAELTYGDANTVLPISLAKDAVYGRPALWIPPARTTFASATAGSGRKTSRPPVCRPAPC